MYHGNRLKAASALFIFVQAVDRVIKHAHQLFYLRYLFTLRIEYSHYLAYAESCFDSQLFYAFDACFFQENTESIRAGHGSVGLQHAVIYVHDVVALGFHGAHLAVRSDGKDRFVAVIL